MIHCKISKQCTNIGFGGIKTGHTFSMNTVILKNYLKPVTLEWFNIKNLNIAFSLYSILRFQFLNAFHFTITLTFQLTFTFSIFPLVQVKLRGLQVLSLQSIPAHLSANAWARHSTLLFLCYWVDNLVCELTRHVKATCKHIIYNTTVWEVNIISLEEVNIFFRLLVNGRVSNATVNGSSSCKIVQNIGKPDIKGHCQEQKEFLLATP